MKLFSEVFDFSSEVGAVLVNHPDDGTQTRRKRFYAGIGSRETPPHILKHMQGLGRRFAASGYVLRSGGADGADKAFEAGCDELSGNKEIYLPWRFFNGNESPLYEVSKEAMDLARRFHPKWSGLSHQSRLLIARNGYQVLGLDLNTPVDFISYWTPGGKILGGTGQALRIAKHYGIETVFAETDYGR